MEKLKYVDMSWLGKEIGNGTMKVGPDEWNTKDTEFDELLLFAAADGIQKLMILSFNFHVGLRGF